MIKNLKNTLIQVTQNGMGTGDESLGLQLVVNYLKLVNEEVDLPKVISFYNGGVKLICKDSPAVDVLMELENKGVKLIACKTCLIHFGLLEQKQVGITATMVDILDFQKMADKVINI